VPNQNNVVKFQRPVQRAPVRLFNWLARTLGSHADLSEEGLCRAACRSTRLDDFGEDGFREPLRVLLRSLEEEADLHPFGRLFARSLVLRCLVNRLKLTADWKRWPQILDEEVRGPVFVLGLPRCGTTLMHNLLAADPASRSPAYWEAHDLSPPPARDSYATDPRRRRARIEVRVLDYLVPNLLAMHEISAEGPEECYALLANAFAGVQFSWMFDVPGFNDWLSGRDMRDSYRYYRKQLQLLQWRCPGDRWVLKSPTHLWTADALLAVFPDARIVQIHRDPLKVVASACSLGATMRGLTSRDVALHDLGRKATEGLATGVGKCTAARAAAPAGQFLDLHYLEFVRDPLATVRGVYNHFDMPFTAQAEAAVKAALARHPQNKRGAHRYTLEQFGLNADEERCRYAVYCETYGVQREA